MQCRKRSDRRPARVQHHAAGHGADHRLLPRALERLGGARSKRQVVLDSVVQEIDIPTGLVLFQWDSLDHVPLADSYEGCRTRGRTFDYFHINSVQQRHDGNLLISARNTWAAYKVIPSTGASCGRSAASTRASSSARAWRSPSSTTSACTPRTTPTVTLFDDGAGPPGSQPVAGDHRPAQRQRQDGHAGSEDLHSPALAAAFEGNVQRCPAATSSSAGVSSPTSPSSTPRGQMVFDGHFVDELELPRLPLSVDGHSDQPAGGRRSSGGARRRVHELERRHPVARGACWRASADTLQAVLTASERGFEPGPIASEPYVAVQALDAAGRALATSASSATSGLRSLTRGLRSHAAVPLGANTVTANEADAILTATDELMRELIERDSLNPRRSWAPFRWPRPGREFRP